MKTRMPYYQFTPSMLEAFVKHKLSGKTQVVFHYLSLNQNYKRGRLDPLDIEDIADAADVTIWYVYKALKKLAKAGLYTPEKWGKISGYLPKTQIANHAIRIARKEKKEREFYEELYRRIEADAKQRTMKQPARMIETLFHGLCREKHESKQFFPDLGGGATQDTIIENIQRYVDDPILPID